MQKMGGARLPKASNTLPVSDSLLAQRGNQNRSSAHCDSRRAHTGALVSPEIVRSSRAENKAHALAGLH